jgi:hypothetical protein
LNSLALHHSEFGRYSEALGELRESIDHSTRAGDLVTNLTAMNFASLVFARAGVDEAAAVLVGSSYAGLLARGYNVDDLPRAATAVQALGQRLGAQRWREATERGAAMDYDELLAFSVGALDDALRR